MTSNFTVATTLATCVLAVGSIVAGIFAYRTWKEQRRESNTQVEASQQAATERLRHQAIGLVVWMDYDEAPPVTHAGFTRWPQLTVVNHSDAPAYEILVGWGATFTGVQPSDEVEASVTSKHPLIPPNTKVPVDMPDEAALRAEFGTGADFAKDIDAYVEFDDAAGHRWRRFATGLLQEVRVSPSSRAVSHIAPPPVFPASAPSEGGELRIWGRQPHPGRLPSKREP
jgi:hypothetical protein